MTEASPANLQLAIVLPLGVVANQLMRIETELRFLNMKASLYGMERESGAIAVPLEKINATLDLIRDLVSDLEVGIRPPIASAAGASSNDPAARKPMPYRDD